MTCLSYQALSAPQREMCHKHFPISAKYFEFTLSKYLATTYVSCILEMLQGKIKPSQIQTHQNGVSYMVVVKLLRYLCPIMQIQ